MTIPEIRLECIKISASVEEYYQCSVVDRAEQYFQWIFKNHPHSEIDSEVIKKLNSLNSKIDKIMTKQERFDAILTKMDAVTTNIAEDFAAFIKEAQEGDVSEESIAKAEANVTRLEELAATKENPVPGEEIPPADQP